MLVTAPPTCTMTYLNRITEFMYAMPLERSRMLSRINFKTDVPLVSFSHAQLCDPTPEHRSAGRGKRHSGMRGVRIPSPPHRLDAELGVSLAKRFSLHHHQLWRAVHPERHLCGPGTVQLQRQQQRRIHPGHGDNHSAR